MTTRQGPVTRGPNPEAGPTPEKGNHRGGTWGLALPLKSNFISAALRSSLERGPEGRGEAAQFPDIHTFVLSCMNSPLQVTEADVGSGNGRPCRGQAILGGSRVGPHLRESRPEGKNPKPQNHQGLNPMPGSAAAGPWLRRICSQPKPRPRSQRAVSPEVSAKAGVPSPLVPT